MSRPQRSPALAANICQYIEDGFSLRYACSALDFPSSSFCDWLKQDKSVAEQYARAREIQSDKYADEIVELSDSATPETANKVRLQVDSRKWIASKLKPKVYGDRPAEVNVSTTNNFLVISQAEQQAIQERTRRLLTEK